MAILEILTFPNPTLREKAVPIEVFDSKLKTFIQDMIETMYDAPGVGLAANQVGRAIQLLVIDVDYSIEGDEDSGIRKYINQNPRVFINPKIIEQKGKQIFKEGCLSVPGFSEEVNRANSIEVEYQDEEGKKLRLSADGFLAVALQHEMDHLIGRLFIDRLSFAKRDLIKGKLKKERNKKFERSRFHVDL